MDVQTTVEEQLPEEPRDTLTLAVWQWQRVMHALRISGRHDTLTRALAELLRGQYGSRMLVTAWPTAEERRVIDAALLATDKPLEALLAARDECERLAAMCSAFERAFDQALAAHRHLAGEMATLRRVAGTGEVVHADAARACAIIRGRVNLALRGRE